MHAHGLGCELRREGSDFFDHLLFFTPSGAVTLEIILIHFDQWNRPESKEQYRDVVVKMKELRESGRRVVILWQDQWIKNQEIVVSRIKSILGISKRIPGRLTYVARIDKKCTTDFLSKNHLQGNVSSKYRYGLFLPVRYFRVLETDDPVRDQVSDLLVAVATFSQVRLFQRNDKPFRSFEMIRFANLLHTTVVGGMDKLLTAFTHDFNPDDIMTYADLEWSDGQAYQRLGFEAISERAPVAFWVNQTTFTRITVENEGFIPITNAGSRKYVKLVNP